MKLLSTAAILALSLSACVANPPRETAVRKTTTTTTTNEVLVDDNNDGYYDRAVPVPANQGVVMEKYGYNAAGERVVIRENTGSDQVIYYDDNYPHRAYDGQPIYNHGR